MEQMWQVCELEDSRQRFTVAGVPETWAIKLADGTLVCYWPKYNPGLKIRTRQIPNFEEKYTFYKCRILMDGEKFSTYQKARDAEKDAENFSSIKDRSAITETSWISNTVQDVCDSTMKFDVADVDVNDNFDLKDVSDLGTNMDEMVGNDSYEFNKAVLKGDGYHARESVIFEVEDDDECAGNLLRVANEPKSFKMASYRAFKSAGNFFTSTLVDELEASHDISELELYDDVITSKISKTEKKLCLFVEDIKKDLIDIKEMARSANKLKMRHVPDKTNANSPARKNISLLSNDIHESNQKSQSLNENDSVPGINILNAEVLNLPVPSTQDITSSAVIIPSTQDDLMNLNDTFVTKPAKNIVSNVHEETWNVQESSLCEVMQKTLNDTFVTKSKKHDDSNVVPLDVSIEKTLNVPESLLREVTPKTLNDPNKTFVGERATVILLPNKDVDHYKRNEELLDETALEEALTKHLTPFDEEDEITYLNRAILMLFDDNFLLKHVSWKNGKNHVNIKNSYLMGCWNAGHQKKFHPDVDNRKFKLQIRRVKQAKRALIKKELKRAKKQLKLSASFLRN